MKKIYQGQHENSATIKIINVYPRNLTQPSFVKKSYLYLGTPPLIKIKKDRQLVIFKVNKRV